MEEGKKKLVASNGRLHFLLSCNTSYFDFLIDFKASLCFLVEAHEAWEVYQGPRDQRPALQAHSGEHHGGDPFKKRSEIEAHGSVSRNRATLSSLSPSNFQILRYFPNLNPSKRDQCASGPNWGPVKITEPFLCCFHYCIVVLGLCLRSQVGPSKM